MYKLIPLFFLLACSDIEKPDRYISFAAAHSHKDTCIRLRFTELREMQKNCVELSGKSYSTVEKEDCIGQAVEFFCPEDPSFRKYVMEVEEVQPSPPKIDSASCCKTRSLASEVAERCIGECVGKYRPRSIGKLKKQAWEISDCFRLCVDAEY